MKVKAVKAGQYQHRFYKPGEVLEIPAEIFDQYKEHLSKWVEVMEETI